MTTPDDIIALRDRLKAWLLDHAFPLWWARGADHVKGGWFDKIGQDGQAIEGPRRARVLTRQIFTFGAAGDLGWTGPWQAARDHGKPDLLGHFHRLDGLFRILVSPDGAPLDEEPAPYEQAFALLALSRLSLEDQAVASRDALAARLGRPDGGVHDDASREYPLRANPLMHLFEAALAWAEVGTDPGWADLAGRIGDIALNQLVDPATGALCELYGHDWVRLPEADVEPGHQFEWGWLLLEMARLLNRPEALKPALRLIDLAEAKGVESGVAIMALDQALQPRDRNSRLWAQTERVRAGAAAGALTGERRYWDIAAAGVAGLEKFLAVPVPGLWSEYRDAGGKLADLPAPASSLYHITGAVLALDLACGT